MVTDIRVKKDGREIRKSETFNGTEGQAEERTLELKKEVRERPSWSESTTRVITFGDALTVYKNSKLVIAPKEKGRLDRLMKDLGGVPVRNLPETLEKYLSLIRQFPSPTTKRLLAIGSINIPRDKVLTEGEIRNLMEVIREKAPHPVAIVRFTPGGLQNGLESVPPACRHLRFPFPRYPAHFGYKPPGQWDA